MKEKNVCKEVDINGNRYIKADEVTKTYNLVEQKIEHPFEIDEDYFIRTVTYHLVGRVKKASGKFLILKNASWLADSGRFMNAIQDGTLDEVEPVGDVFVNIDSIVDAFPWCHKLPKNQK